MDVNEIELQGVNWMHLAQDRDKWQALVNMVMSLQVP
jgi:hypothetical protein